MNTTRSLPNGINWKPRRPARGPRRRWFTHLAILVFALVAPRAFGQNTWVGGVGGDGLWGTGTNWSTTSAPAGTYNQTLVFAGSPLLSSTNNVSGLTLSSATAIRFDAAGFTLSGSAITLAGNIVNAITTNGTNRISFDQITVSAMRTVSGSFSGGIANTTILNSNITGAGGITLGGGNGTLAGNSPIYTLTGSNSFSGGLTLSAYQTVNVSNASGFGSSVASNQIRFNRATLNYTGAATTLANNTFFDASGSSMTFNLTNPLSFTGTTTVNRGGIAVGSGSLTLKTLAADPANPTVACSKTGTGTLTITDPAQAGFSGKPVTVNGGLLVMGTSSALGTGTLTLTSGTLTGSTNLTLSMPVTANGGSIGGAVNIQITNGIAGTGNLTKVGSGTLTASGNNTYAGSTTASGGVLVISGSSSGSGNVTISGGGIHIGHANALSSGTLTFSGVGGSFDNVSGGPLTLATNNPLAFAGGTATFIGTDSLDLGVGTGTFTNNMILNVAAKTLTLGGSLRSATFGFSKYGAGTLALSGTSFTGTGNLDIYEGTLRYDNASAISATNSTRLRGGVIGIAYSGTFAPTVGSTAGTGQLALGGLGGGGFAGYGGDRAVNLGGASATMTWNSTVGFYSTGDPMVLGAADTTGTIDFQNPIALNGAIRTIRAVRGSADVAGILSNVISGNASSGIVKTGDGVLALTAANTYSGATSVDVGTLLVDGSILNSPTVTVASGATLGGSGNVTAIAGNGLVSPGNSPGILTGSSVDLSAGLDFAFEFTQAGAPTWSTTTASGNDVLRLESVSTPIVGTAGATNVFDVYFAATGRTYLGGLFTDLASNFESSVSAATFNYFVQDASGTTTFNGTQYASLTGSQVSRRTVQVASADFSTRPVTNGYTMEFVVVPEPQTIVLVGIGSAVIGWSLIDRRRRLADRRAG